MAVTGWRRRPVAAGLVGGLLFAATPAARAADSLQELLQQMKQLNARVQTLENENRQLKHRLDAEQQGQAAIAAKVKVLNNAHARLNAALDSDRISANEPELATRLKAVESDTLSMHKIARTVESLQGITVGADFTTVGQRLDSGSRSVSQLNYRADVTVGLPAGEIGGAKGSLFAQFRIGQGPGVAPDLNTFSGPNATSFQLGGVSQPSDSAVMLAQAWYQADIPLSSDRYVEPAASHLEFNFGKMDPFLFFDQNAAANDENNQFLASQFVHNALLDNPMAANVGADAYGFTPGIRLAYLNERDAPEGYTLSLGVFGAGNDASYQGFGPPFVIAQAERTEMMFDGLAGHYRLLWWSNGQAATYRTAFDGTTKSHQGIGFNFDQRIGDAVTLFGRLGKAWGDGLPFDQTASLGAEIGGDYWNRGADALGFAAGANWASADFRRDAPTLDANGDGVPDYGYTASGSEKTVELYYRYWFSKQFQISPDLQLTWNRGADSAAPITRTVGLRARIAF